MNQIVTLPDAAAKVPAHTTEMWPVDRLKAYERNARKHPKKQIEQLRASFRKFGQVWPLLIRPDGTLIAGHGRLEAARAEGLTEVRVIVATGWSEEQCRAFTLLDNKSALNSEWDEALLGLELAELGTLGIDPSLMGFDLEVAALSGTGMKRPIENNSSPGQAVYDPFVGSGTTIIAAEMTGRCCHAIELDPAYVDVCIKRWQDFTGEKAILDGDGRTFEQVAAERLQKAA